MLKEQRHIVGTPILNVSGLNLSYQETEILCDLEWTIFPNEHWLIGGKSGSGKSSLAKAILGQVKTSGEVRFTFGKEIQSPRQIYYVSNWYTFTDLEGNRNFYYQQRYNRQQQNSTLTVYADLMVFGKKHRLEIEHLDPILEALGFTHCRETQLIELSSGEHKKIQLVQALWLRPEILILDEPYTGLDKLSRANLNRILDDMAQNGSTLILLTNDRDIPTSINRFAQIENHRLKEVWSKDGLDTNEQRETKTLPYFLQKAPTVDSDTIVELKSVSVRYGEKAVLKDIDWTIKSGEKWVLQGHNGSGKSTLLSLLNGDHPQAYNSNIWIFGQKRGSGESIWELKEKMGIISPEMHWYFDESATVWHTVASGLFDSIGLFQKLKFEEEKQVEQLLYFFDLLADKGRLLNTLPLGKQRLALLARTIIKSPPLLILDEPCQGLDSSQAKYFNDVLDEISAFGNTLIYVGHYETQLPSCLTHRLVLEKGKVLSCGKIN